MRTITAASLLGLLAACGPATGIQDDLYDSFVGNDGKADAFGVKEGSPEAFGVLMVVNSASEDELADKVKLSGTVIANLLEHRRGADQVDDSDDDDDFQSLAELDDVPRVGKTTFTALLKYARRKGYVREPMTPPGYDQPTVNDVAVLYPLPAAGTDGLLAAGDEGNGGALLPRGTFDKIGRPVFPLLSDADQYDLLRVVAVRFDPCFKTALEAECQPQVRLVFQAVQDGKALDGAVHALYNLKAADWEALTGELRELRNDAPENLHGLPVQVSPALRSQGLGGAYGKGLARIIKTYAGRDTLARMTFMTRTMARETTWQFGGFHVKASAQTGFPAAGPIEIFGSHETLQTLTSASLPHFRFDADPGVADPRGVAGLSQDDMRLGQRPARLETHDWAMAHEDPTQTVPDTTDCVSCHVAPHASRTLEDLDPSLLSDEQKASRARRKTGRAEDDRENLRAFGWFDSQPAISRRAANEAAAAARAMATN